jgi:hypothetical protein
MNKQEKINITIFLILWTTIVTILFLHTSKTVDFKFLHFTQATGGLVMVEDSYKATNILGLKDRVYAVPHGAPFVHPKRKAKMKRKGIFEASSLEEAKRMVDSGKEDIEPKLIPIEKHFLGFNIYRRGNKYYGVPPQGEPNQYSEVYLGNSLEEAKAKITSIWKSRQ